MTKRCGNKFLSFQISFKKKIAVPKLLRHSDVSQKYIFTKYPLIRKRSIKIFIWLKMIERNYYVCVKIFDKMSSSNICFFFDLDWRIAVPHLTLILIFAFCFLSRNRKSLGVSYDESSLDIQSMKIMKIDLYDSFLLVWLSVHVANSVRRSMKEECECQYKMMCRVMIWGTRRRYEKS